METFLNDIGTVELYLVKKRDGARTPIEIRFLNHAPNFSIINQKIDDGYYFELTLKTINQNFILKRENESFREIESSEYKIDIPIDSMFGNTKPANHKIYFCPTFKNSIQTFHFNERKDVIICKVGVISQRDTFYFVYQKTKYKGYNHGAYVEYPDLENKKQLEKIILRHVDDEKNIRHMSEYEHLIDKNLEELLNERKRYAIVKRYDYLDQSGIAYIHGTIKVSFKAVECSQGFTPIFFERADIISFGKEKPGEIKNIKLEVRVT